MSGMSSLKKPVHVALIKEAHIQKLTREGKLPRTLVSLEAPPTQPLPVETKTKTLLVRESIFKGGNDIRKQWSVRAKLRVLHESIPPLAKEDVPPCHTCKAAPCCKAFVVGLRQLEYESGLYGDCAIEITPEVQRQLRGRLLAPVVVNSPMQDATDPESVYYLEGKAGDPCPFLGEDNRCGIYNSRPIVCRTYTCVDDTRITQEMRDGTVPAVLPFDEE